MEINSRGLPPSKQHIQNRHKEQEYIQEMIQFLNKRGGKIWDEELRDEYKRILIKYGMISPKPKGENDQNQE